MLSYDYKYKYCPRCGEINTEKFSRGKCCNFCTKDISIFNRQEMKKATWIETNITMSDPYELKVPCDLNGATEELYRYVWETYVDIPDNPCFNREAHEKLKADRLEFFANGGWRGNHINNAIKAENAQKYDSKSNKDASVVGRAVAGGVIAGPVGAVVGAASAIDKNMKNKK